MKLIFQLFYKPLIYFQISVTHHSMTWLYSMHLWLSYAISFRPSSLQCLSSVAIHLLFILRVCEFISFVNILLLYWHSITITYFTAVCTDHRTICNCIGHLFWWLRFFLQICSAVFLHHPAPSDPSHHDGTTPMVCLQELLHEINKIG